jgi:Tol biopolymer transport system component
MKPQIKVVGRIMLGFVLIMCVVADLGHAQTTTRVSVSSAGGEGDDQSFDPSLSADGRFVAFASRSTNLVPGDTNFSRDIFVHDRQTGQTSRVSVSSTGQQADNASFDPQLSADGRFVAFWSYAKNLVVGDTNGREDFFVHDRQTGQTSRVNVSSTGAEAGQPTKITGFIGVALSADGRFVAFDSCSTNLVLGDTNAQCDIFVHDRQTGQTTRVSVSSAGEQANGDSTRPQLSTDGQFVAFISEASNLVATDMNNDWDVFVHDRQTGQTTRVSVTSTGAESSGVGSPDARISLSGDGQVVAFDACGSNLFPADPNGGCDIFLHDRQTGQTSWVSVSSTGEPANDNSFFPQLSADGRFVTFNSLASNLVSDDTNATIFSLDYDTFVHDLQTGQTTRVSVSSAGVQAAPSDCECSEPAINGDGRVIAFTSNASNLVPGDTNTAGQFSEGGDIFVHAIPPPNVIPVGIGDLDCGHRRPRWQWHGGCGLARHDHGDGVGLVHEWAGRE